MNDLKEALMQTDTDKLNKLRSAVWEFCHNLEKFEASTPTQRVLNAITNSPMYKDMKFYSKIEVTATTSEAII